MNIGSLYLVKNGYWILFLSKETVDTTLSCTFCSTTESAIFICNNCYCGATWFSPNEYVIFLEEDDKFKKVLTSDGKIGWTSFVSRYNDYFEEVIC